ncbi:hypothetical protein LTR37_000078 [Vermiconidia calcicola]|uniref:Uncharacterized protein n=1 Tax=Vermiconidia calcicola TaxID=1690605 RepID=A0ACC3P0S3_9PEZI|nr:hypothetical protein LTR37_000078 [Vermiconidia calcicola]
MPRRPYPPPHTYPSILLGHVEDQSFNTADDLSLSPEDFSFDFDFDFDADGIKSPVNYANEATGVNTDETNADDDFSLPPEGFSFDFDIDADGIKSHIDDPNEAATTITPRSSTEQATDSPRGSAARPVRRVADPGHAYRINKGVFSDGQKELIQMHSDDSASSVFERMREIDPAMPHTYRQIKGAIENERRKKNRREANGAWAEEELEMIKANLGMKPKELANLLRETSPSFRKNVDQVRDMKNQLSQKIRGRVRKRKIPVVQEPGSQQRGQNTLAIRPERDPGAAMMPRHPISHSAR